MGKGMSAYSGSKGKAFQPKQTLKKTGLIASPGTKVAVKGIGKK
jgi:hypothetical protein